jgi:hypothetical protein
MSDESTKPKLVVSDETLDEDEAEFRRLRRDLPGIKGASAIGIMSINVAKTPGKNEFFRTNPEFRPIVPLVDIEVGMENNFLPLITTWWLLSPGSASLSAITLFI